MVILLSTRGTAGSDIWCMCLAEEPMGRSYHLIPPRRNDTAAPKEPRLAPDSRVPVRPRSAGSPRRPRGGAGSPPAGRRDRGPVRRAVRLGKRGAAGKGAALSPVTLNAPLDTRVCLCGLSRGPPARTRPCRSPGRHGGGRLGPRAVARTTVWWLGGGSSSPPSPEDGSFLFPLPSLSLGVGASCRRDRGLPSPAAAAPCPPALAKPEGGGGGSAAAAVTAAR
ncbi:hypothetical protein T03_13903 [Trichinella britovi]|uniref:Uncharacterized protein n=1 Tax=Trichinella britovi TaxID=45882 RepID=A0A0V1C3A6_TRIBR|nr:hypothetical protein T03_13903 [Trichinella britovi]